MAAGKYPENAMSCKGILLVFAKGSSVVKLPTGVPDERLGPVLASLESCAPGADGFHRVPVKEIPTAALGAPLTHFLAGGKLPLSTSLLLLAPSYKAAERLDVAGMVRAVERAALAAVAAGDVRLKDLAAAFAGCPRVAALCDNYLSIPGIRAPPRFNIMTKLPELVDENGALMVACIRTYPGETLDTVLLIADAQRCTELSSSVPVCKSICNHLEGCSVEPNTRGRFTVISLSYPYMSVVPRDPDSWLIDASGASNHVTKCSPVELPALLRNGKASSYISIVACSEGYLLFSSDRGADVTYRRGFEMSHE